MANTIKLKFDGETQECLIHESMTGEIICYAKDRRFVKFPAGTDLKEAAKNHNAANSEKPITAEESEAKQSELDAWFNE